jgi:hypothetical protein
MAPDFFDPAAPRPLELPDETTWRASTYLQYLNGLEGEMRQWQLRWVQVCRFARHLPAGCQFFEGRVASLGIDRLGLPNDQAMELLEAVAGLGLGIPGTAWKLRVARPWYALFEPTRGDESPLPTHWLEGLELHGESTSLWIGRRALEHPLCPAPYDAFDEAALGASKRTDEIDWSSYQSRRDGWQLRDAPNGPNFMEANP